MNRPLAFAYVLGTEFQVTVAGLGPRGPDSEGQQAALAAHELGARRHRRAKLRLLADDMIGRQHDADGLRVQFSNGTGRQTGAGGGVATHRLGQDVFWRQLREDVAGGFRRFGGSHDPHSIPRYQVSQSFEGHPEEGNFGREGEELFGKVAARSRPESRSRTPGHDHGMQHDFIVARFGLPRVFEESEDWSFEF